MGGTAREKGPLIFWAVSVLRDACWVTVCVTGFGTSSQGELHLPLSPGKADVTLLELGILLDWVSPQQVHPAVSSNLWLLDGLVFTVKNKKLCFIWQSD